MQPLVRRAQGSSDQETVRDALGRLDELALGQALLQQVREVLADKASDTGSTSWKDPVKAMKSVKVAKALYLSRRISTQEYVFFAASPVENVHEGRWFDGAYDSDLKLIKNRMKEIEEEYDIGPDEYLPLSEGPEEYRQLNTQHDEILGRKLTDTLREFHLDDLADLHENNPKEFRRLKRTTGAG